MAFPIGRHHDSFQVWVITKLDPKQVEDFPLIPVCRTPDRRYRVERLSLANLHNHPKASVVTEGVQEISHLKTRLTRPQIHTCYCTETLKSGYFLQKTTNSRNLLR